MNDTTKITIHGCVLLNLNPGDTTTFKATATTILGQFGLQICSEFT